MKTVTVRNLVIGDGAPKIIVSLMGIDIATVKSEALAYREADFDILEWRVDHFGDVSSTDAVLEAARAIRDVIADKPLLSPSAAPKKAVNRHCLSKTILHLTARR
jgi:3-dehydroquinate dehydratase-1